MQKPLHILSGWFALFCLVFIANVTLAQTYPTPQSLPYSQNFGTAAFSTMPAGTNTFTRNNTITTQALAETATPLGNATVLTLTGTIANSTAAGTYGYSQAGTNAMLLIQTDRSGNTNATNSLIAGLNTTGWMNVNFAFQITIANGSANSGVVYQYRVGTTGAWTNLSGANNPLLGNASATPFNLSFTLPVACNNQPAVYIRWSPWNGETNNNVNTRFRFTVDNISATGTVIPPSPGGIYGQNLWLKANTGTTVSGSNLTGWTDQTGTNTFSVVGTPTLTANAINFNPVVSFANTDARTALPSTRLVGNQSISVVEGFAVYKYNSTTNRGATMGSTVSNTNYGRALFAADNDQRVYFGNGLNSTYQSYANTSLDAVYTINNLDVSPTVSPFATGRLNGTSQSVTAGAGGDFASIAITPLIGGTNNTGGNNAGLGWYPFSGSLAEVVLYPSAATVSDKGKIESYLGVKYGIHLAGNYVNSAGTVIWDATTNAAYHNDVFGIGRDDASALNQTSSNSINSGSGNGTGQAGKGNLVISQSAIAGSSAFMMLGHNNGSLSLQLSGLPSDLSYSQRIGRQWKVRYTGSFSTNIVFSFDVNGLNAGIVTNASKLAMLVDVSGSGNFPAGSTVAISPDSVVGTKVYYHASPLQDNVFTFALITPNNWIGTADKLWNNPANWSLGRIPVSLDSVRIDKNIYTNPVTLNVPFTVGYRLNFFNNPDFTIAPGGMLSVSATGIADLTTSPRKLILSDSSGSGLIGQINGTMLGNGVDSWAVERWFGARRSFRYIAPSLVTSTSFFSTVRYSWMGGDALGDAYNYPYPLGSSQYSTKGTFLHITGGTKAQGFDQTQTNNPSLWTWTNTNQEWAAATTTNFFAQHGTGYRLVVRGDRGTNLDRNRPTASETKILFLGNLLNSSYTVPTANIAPQDTGYSMIANPYQSTVDATAITRTGMTNYMYIWDAKIIGTSGFGAFVTVDLVNNTNNMGNVDPAYSSAADKWIQPGQAVFFQNNPAGPTPRAVTFVQSAKGGPTERRRVFGSEPTPNAGDIVSQINLWSSNTELGVEAPVDGLTIRFGSQYTTAADYEDGNKLNNTDESISVWNNNRSVSIDKRNLPVAGEVIQLQMTRLRVSNYKWVIAGMDLSQLGLEAYLKDAYLNTETLIPLNGLDMAFTTNANDANSSSAYRFSIVFRTSTILPITFVKLETEQQGLQFNLVWTSSSNKAGNIFEIQRSANGNQFDKLASLPVSSNGTANYNWLDNNPSKGTNFYRIKLTEPDGTIVYSNITKVNLAGNGKGFDVYPNPVKGSNITLLLNELPAGKYQVLLVNGGGQLIQQTSIQHNGGNASRQLNFGAALPFGNYQVILQLDDQKYTRKIIIE